MTRASIRRLAAPGQLPESRQQRPYNTADAHTFLDQQAADAQTAIHQTLTEMQATAREVANVRWWTQHYPWSAVGAVAVLSYVVTTAVLAPPAPPPPDPTPGASGRCPPRLDGVPLRPRADAGDGDTARRPASAGAVRRPGPGRPQHLLRSEGTQAHAHTTQPSPHRAHVLAVAPLAPDARSSPCVPITPRTSS